MTDAPLTDLPPTGPGPIPNPALVTLPEHGGIAAELLRRLDTDRPVLATLSVDGWSDTTGRELAALVRAVAAGLAADGVRPGDRVALLGGNTRDWVVLDLALLLLGAVTVPIYPTSSPVQVAHAIADSGAVRTFAE